MTEYSNTYRSEDGTEVEIKIKDRVPHARRRAGSTQLYGPKFAQILSGNSRKNHSDKTLFVQVRKAMA